MTRISLVEALAAVPDPRDRQGRRHPLVAILNLVVVAVMCGARGPDSIMQFGRDHGVKLAHALGFLRGKTPTKSTLSVLLRRLDVAAFEAALTRWVCSRLDEMPEHLALDGKTLRGSADGDLPGVHLLALYATHMNATLAQIRVDSKTNEYKAAFELLGILPLRGTVVTGDAMFCHRDLCRQIVDRGGAYLLFVKDNQATLKRDIAASFETPADFPPSPTPTDGARSTARVGIG